MGRTGILLAGLLGLCLGMGPFFQDPATAEITDRDVIDPGPRNEAYDQAINWRGIQRKMIYLRPGADYSPDASIDITVPDPPDAESAADQRRTVWIAIFLILTLFVVFMFARYGNAISVSFGDTRERRRQDRAAEGEEARAIHADQPVDQFLDRLRQMADRRLALILLVGRALEHAADANGLRLGRAQTAREVVRALPTGWAHLRLLRGLVRKAEVVHFGGRPVGEDEWQECLSAAEPLFAGVAR